ICVWTTALALFLLLVAREIRRGFFPSATHIGCLQQVLRAVVVSVRLMAAADDWRVPVETILDVFRIHPEILNRRCHDLRGRLRSNVEHLDRSLIAATHYVIRFIGIECEKRALSAGRVSPARSADATASQLATRDRDRRVVLLPTIDAIRKLIVDVDAIKLRGRHVVL